MKLIDVYHKYQIDLTSIVVNEKSTLRLLDDELNLIIKLFSIFKYSIELDLDTVYQNITSSKEQNLLAKMIEKNLFSLKLVKSQTTKEFLVISPLFELLDRLNPHSLIESTKFDSPIKQTSIELESLFSRPLTLRECEYVNSWYYESLIPHNIVIEVITDCKIKGSNSIQGVQRALTAKMNKIKAEKEQLDKLLDNKTIHD
jgi:hypothetical protein